MNSSRVLVGAAVGYLRLEGRSVQLRARLNAAARRFFGAALTDREKTLVTLNVYDRMFARRARRDVHAWEDEWFCWKTDTAGD